MHCTCMHRFKNTIYTYGVKEIFRNSMWIACLFNVFQTCDLTDLKDFVFAKLRYGGKRDEKLIRPLPHAPGGLINFAVENDHLAIEPFKSAEAKVAFLQKCPRRKRSRVDALYQSS